MTIDDKLYSTAPRTSRSVQEFLIDFLLEEEFCSNLDFAREFLLACGSELTLINVKAAARSVSDKFGEADLIVLLMCESADRNEFLHALLIEDKITAGAQPRQAERYNMRGKDGISNGLWDSFQTVLVAPKNYINVAHGYDVAVELELLKDLFCRSDEPRRAYKIRVIEEAIAKKNAVGVQNIDPAMTDFRRKYYFALQAFNERAGTDFTMRPPADTYYGDYWFILKSQRLPKNAEIRHLSNSGKIQLSFKNTSRENFEPLSNVLTPDMRLEAGGKYKQHSAIEIFVDSLAVYDNFERDEAKVLHAFEIAKKLIEFYQNNRVLIDSIVSRTS